jgi:hypothetical protein
MKGDKMKKLQFLFLLSLFLSFLVFLAGENTRKALRQSLRLKKNTSLIRYLLSSRKIPDEFLFSRPLI